jgi:hypothetical protein
VYSATIAPYHFKKQVLLPYIRKKEMMTPFGGPKQCRKGCDFLEKAWLARAAKKNWPMIFFSDCNCSKQITVLLTLKEKIFLAHHFLI